jgi:signal transduction histidine kinase
MLARLAHALAEPVLILRGRSARAGEADPPDDTLARVSAQLDDLLDGIVRLERSGDPVLPEAVELADLVAAARARAAERAPGLPLALPAPPSARLHVDPRAGELLLTELLVNAAVHGAERVALSAVPAGPRHLRITVDDDGPGIPPDRRDEALEPFRRLNGSRRAGVGLAVARRVVAAHGGLLELGSSPLGGLRASFVLPTA